MWAQDLQALVRVSGLEFGGGTEHAEDEEGAGCWDDAGVWEG